MKKVAAWHTLALRQIGRAVVSVYRSLYFPPVIIFSALLIASFFAWQAAKLSLEQDLDAAADERVQNVEQAFKDHLGSYEQILHSGVGLFQGSTKVTAEDWKNYLSAFDLPTKYASVQGIGFASVFSTDQLPAIKADMQAQGITNFALTPIPSSNTVHAAVLYLQIVAAKGANPSLGFDMYAEPLRQSTMLKARDTGNVVITPRIELASSDESTSKAGFNMYAPFYQTGLPAETVDERTAALRGYVYAAFRSSVFFSGIANDANRKALAFRVSVAQDNSDQLLFQSESFASMSKKADMIVMNRPVRLYGQTWVTRFVLNPRALISDVQLKRPGGVLFFGVFSAVLISTIVFLLLRSRAKDLMAQKEQAVELAKDELLSLASHQLRTPATGVKQYVGMVLQGFAGKVPKNQLMLLEKAYASNDRQLRIINEILHLAKIDAGRIVLAKQYINLSDLINDVVNEQEADIAQAEHHLQLTLPARPLRINADTHMLRMAIENVLSNAIKYTKHGGHIEIRARRSGTNAAISISDNGVGIDAGDIEAVFRQFSRLPNEMSQKVGGTGVGLYLAKHLVELHGGRIEVASTPGKGSTFTIILPLQLNPIRNFTVRGLA
jgi:two-component system, sensor histidine kinase